MASATGTVRHPKGVVESSPEAGPSAGRFLKAYLDSSVGAKLTVGMTGALLVVFVVFHMIGNLKLFQGPEAINAYAYFLKHSLGVLLWIGRAGLLVLFVLHVVLAVRLKRRAVAARPVAYAHAGSAQATLASRTMIWTGITVGLFLLFHLAQFTFGWVGGVEVVDPVTGRVAYTNYLDLKDPLGHHDVYSMAVAGFKVPWVVALYVLAQLALFVHLRHGIPSVFQTLGVKSARYRRPIDLLGLAIALTILLGNVAIVLAVWLGYLQPVSPLPRDLPPLVRP